MVYCLWYDVPVPGVLHPDNRRELSVSVLTNYREKSQKKALRGGYAGWAGRLLPAAEDDLIRGELRHRADAQTDPHGGFGEAGYTTDTGGCAYAVL